MNEQMENLAKRAGIVALVIAALASGWLLRAWAIPEKPDKPVEQAPKAAVEKKPELWICAMNYNPHPYDHDDHRRKCKYCLMYLTLAETADADSDPRELVMSEQAKKLAGIQTSPVERRAVSVELTLSGKVQYDETKLSTITAWVRGRIDRLYIDYTGSTVRRGEHLAELYSPELVSTQEELIQAVKAVAELKDSGVGALGMAQATVVAARKKLRLLGLSEEQIAEIEKQKSASDHVTIRATAGGTVVAKNVKRGDYVKVGSPLYTIADLSRVWVTLDAYEADLVWLGRGGQEVTFTADAYPGQKFRGRITFVAPVVDKRTRSVEVRATVPNPGVRLLPEMLVNGVIRVRVAPDGMAVNRDLVGKWLCTMHPDVVKDGPGKCDVCEMPLVTAESAGYISGEGRGKPLVIPDTAPLLTGKRAIVYVEAPDAKKPTYNGREVLLGPKAGKYYVVLDGLKESERVVTEGNFAIDSDLQIKGKRSMMLPSGGQPAGGRQPRGPEPEKQPAPIKQPTKAATPGIPSAFQDQLAKVVTAYFTISSGLAGDDLAKAAAATKTAGSALGAVDMALLEGDAHASWMKALARLKPPLDAMAKAEDIAGLRAQFDKLSKELPPVIKQFGIGPAGPVYVAKCPMAFDNRGATWLQKDKDVRNPYFGSQMLTCGNVIETIQAAGPED